MHSSGGCYDRRVGVTSRIATVAVLSSAACILFLAVPASASTFAVGDRVQTTANVSVRTAPWVGGQLLVTEPPGIPGIIKGPPLQSGGYTWWYVAWQNGVTGWSTQDYLRAVPADSAALPHVWFSLSDPLSRAVRSYAPNDYLSIFDPDAPWSGAYSGLQVFTISEYEARASPAAELQSIFAFLNTHHIALGLSAQLDLVGRDSAGNIYCGFGASYALSTNTITQAAQRIKDLGGNLQYVVADTTLYFGHFATTGIAGHPPPCQYTISQVAHNVALNVAAVKAVFPNVIIGDDTPINPNVLPDTAGYIAAIREYLADYEHETGSPLAFMMLDVSWGWDWQPQFVAVVNALKQAGIKVGVYYTDVGVDQNTVSDTEWNTGALKHVVEVERYLGIVPDIGFPASWYNHPIQILPETAPSTQSYLLNQYVRWSNGQPMQEPLILSYVAGAGGQILGESRQALFSGMNGTSVIAAPRAGYTFSGWNDGSTWNPRTDTNVVANNTVTALFAPTTDTGSITLSPSPVKVCGPATTEIAVTATANVNWCVYVPDLGTNFKCYPANTTHTDTTTQWVTDGMEFFLRNAATGALLDAATASFTQEGCGVSPPADLSYQCSSDGKSATFSWKRVPAAERYMLRVNYTGNDQSSPSCVDKWLCAVPPDYPIDNVPTTYANGVVSYTVAGLIPLQTYGWWVHSVVAGVQSTATTGGRFTCPAPTGAQAGTITSLSATTILGTAQGVGTVNYKVFDMSGAKLRDATTTVSKGSWSAAISPKLKSGTYSASASAGNGTVLVPIKVFTITTASAGVITHTLAKTWTGPEVRTLQAALAALGYYAGEVTGYFGSLTEAAVERLQAANNLAAVGIVGPKTREILDALLGSGP
jgi:hypothetical protein